MNALTYVISFTASAFFGFLLSAAYFVGKLDDYEDKLSILEAKNQVLKARLALKELVDSQSIVEEDGGVQQ